MVGHNLRTWAYLRVGPIRGILVCHFGGWCMGHCSSDVDNLGIPHSISNLAEFRGVPERHTSASIGRAVLRETMAGQYYSWAYLVWIYCSGPGCDAPLA